ncbi:MAG: hypothetical protein K0R80_2385 [Clostridia bacterium]|jgi:hypothetical protein|nr:hypothetical protein [Clostridia bacterium]MDF2892018.1 hypothetical protein [Clostridia bacterium]
MKQMIFAIVFLIAIITGSLMSIHYISNQSEALQKQLVDLEKHIDIEEWNQAAALYKSIKQKWVSIDHKWSMLIDHYEIDYINMDLGELEAYINARDKTNALAKISSLQLLVKHIPEKEYPSLKNIL